MGIRTVLKRIERAEEVLKTQSVFSQDCICFPENEPPFFGLPAEQEIAARVRCPLHGERFTPRPHLYVAQWRLEKEPARRQMLSDQYRKAWAASLHQLLRTARAGRVVGEMGIQQHNNSCQSWEPR